MRKLTYTIDMSEYDEWLWSEYQKFAHIPGSRRVKSQAEFARWLGVSTSALSHYLNGDQKPTYETAGIMAEKLGQDAYFKAGFVPPDYAGRAEAKSFYEFLQALPVDRIPAFFASIREINAIAADKGIDFDTPEGFEIAKDA